MVRNVAPQQMLALNERAAYSQLNWATTGFKEITAGSDEGMVTRFVQDRLEMILWLRPVQAPELIFGCVIDAESLADLWPKVLSRPGERSSYDAAAGVSARAARRQGAAGLASAGGRRMRTIGNIPLLLRKSARRCRTGKLPFILPDRSSCRNRRAGVRRTLFLLIAVSLGAIACGGWLVVADTRRQLALAQQKTDFVSNVSHELKTPLTSIRMFAELMQTGRGEPPQNIRSICASSWSRRSDSRD